MFHLQLLSTFTVNVLIYMIYFCGCDSFLWLKRKSPENCIILLHLFMNKDSAVLKCSKAKKTNVFSLNGLYWSVQDFHLATRRHCKAMKAMKVTSSLTPHPIDHTTHSTELALSMEGGAQAPIQKQAGEKHSNPQGKRWVLSNKFSKWTSILTERYPSKRHPTE